MKTIYTIAALAFTMLFSAQEAGKAGELLKNEARTTEMQTQRKEILRNKTIEAARRGGSSDVLDNSSYRRNNTNNRSQQRPKNYQWNYNYGYSEVFLRIPERGFFTVEVGDQMMGNASGKFRFFDLPTGRIPISIYDNGYLIYRTQLNVRNNSRMVLDFFTDYGLYLLDTVPVRNQTYGFNDWDDVWNNPYGNGNSGYNNGGYYGNVMSSQEFSGFLNALKRNSSFDDDKSRFIMQQARNVNFTSQQIYAMLQTYSFDDKKLAIAKQLYKKCVDKQSFYIVYDAFAFDRSKRELSDYIARM